MRKDKGMVHMMLIAAILVVIVALVGYLVVTSDKDIPGKDYLRNTVNYEDPAVEDKMMEEEISDSDDVETIQMELDATEFTDLEKDLMELEEDASGL